MEQKVAEIPNHVILRNGTMYGLGTWYARGGDIANKIINREISATDGVTSFIHIKDVVQAIVSAIDWMTPGIYNIVDNLPVSGKVWLPFYAKILGAPVPIIKDGKKSIERGASNVKAKNLCNWRPLFPTFQEGFMDILS